MSFLWQEALWALLLLPLLVAALTSSEEFHSLKNTLQPWSSSQRLSR